MDLNSRSSNPSLTPNLVYLDGVWKNNNDNVELVSDSGKIILTYYAKSINIVASGNGQNATVQELKTPKNISGKSSGSGSGSNDKENNNIITPIEGKNLNNTNHALDLDKKGSVIVDKQRLYNIGLYEDYQPRSLVIDIEGSGFKLYTFTFG